MLLASGLLVHASAPALTSNNTANSTYVVVFNDDQNPAGALSDQLTEFVSDNNAQILYRYNSINGVALRVPSTAVDQLKKLKDVKYVEKDITFNATLDQARAIMGVPQVWDLGYTGKGVKVALVDTGIDTSHPDLKGKVVEWKDFVNGKDQPYDDYGHGTHCAGIIGGTGKASDGKYRGVAPDVQFIGIKVLDKNGQGDLATIIKGIEYAANSDADIISMSLGSEQHSDAVCDAVNKAVQKGKIVVVAAGNSGPDSGTIGCPSDDQYVITVGATDKSDNIASFSSRGPCDAGCQKPEVCAPGVNIISCRASGTNDQKAIDTYYLSESGTSMATPMVSGCCALMVQKDPELTLKEAKSILEKTAKPLGSKTPNKDYGYGRVSIKSAIDYMDGNFTPSPIAPPTPTPVPTPSPAPRRPVNPGNPGYEPGYPGYPTPAFPGYPVPAFPGYPCPPYQGSPYPGYPYPPYPEY
jgi:serine protease AprX